MNLHEKNEHVLELSYVGKDSFSRPVYENGNTLFVDVDPRKDREPKICTKANNCLDGEPDTPIEYIQKYKGVEIRFLPQRMTW